MAKMRTGCLAVAALVLALVAVSVPLQAPGANPGSAWQGQDSINRIALVIGNGAYQKAPLANPVRDARALAKALEGVGFEVTLHTDLNQKSMKRAIRDFGLRLQFTSGIGLFYYAGHGMQVDGHNYLIPVNAPITHETDVAIEAVDAGSILAQMNRAGNQMNLVILDACRNNPFQGAFRSLNAGLAFMDAPSGTLIAYATAPGQLASDGDPDASQGVYAGALVEAIQTPGLSVEEVFKRVRTRVQAQTDGVQTPWEATSLTGSFSFKPFPAEAPPVVRSTPVPADQRAIETAFWETIKDSHSPAVFEVYLRKFPEGPHAEEARLRMVVAAEEASRSSAEEKKETAAPESRPDAAATEGTGTAPADTDAPASQDGTPAVTEAQPGDASGDSTLPQIGEEASDQDGASGQNAGTGESAKRDPGTAGPARPPASQAGGAEERLMASRALAPDGGASESVPAITSDPGHANRNSMGANSMGATAPGADPAQSGSAQSGSAQSGSAQSGSSASRGPGSASPEGSSQAQRASTDAEAARAPAPGQTATATSAASPSLAHAQPAGSRPPETSDTRPQKSETDASGPRAQDGNNPAEGQPQASPGKGQGKASGTTPGGEQLAALSPPPTIHECDRYAADPRDSHRKAPGIPFDALEPAAAITLCEVAHEDFPHEPRFLYQLARGYLRKGDTGEAMAHLRAAARQGYAMAQTDLGIAYWLGRWGLKRDYRRAASWLQLATEGGEPIAATALGALYELGDGVSLNYAHAAALYQYALARGYQSALPRLDNVLPFAVQQRLKELGYKVGDIDGKVGPKTRAAIQAFERAHGLSATGQANRQLFQFLDTVWRASQG